MGRSLDGSHVSITRNTGREQRRPSDPYTHSADDVPLVFVPSEEYVQGSTTPDLLTSLNIAEISSTDYATMYMLICAVWFAIALASMTVITKIARGRMIFAPVHDKPLPPVVNSGSFVAAVHMFVRKGSDSEIGHGDILEFTVPMIGKEVGQGVDMATRNEQHRFFRDALKPQKTRSCDYFAKWGQGMVDLKEELDQLLMLISGRCLIGREVREKMLSEFSALFHELVDNGMRLINALFPYAPTLANRRRDMAHAKISKVLGDIVRSRKRSNSVEEDVLHNLIHSKYRDGRAMTEAEVVGMMIALPFAGKHTSSITSTWTGARLLDNEMWLKAVVEEQKQIIRRYGDHID
ncbi:hypothetical protein ACP70R_008301 [Stipagrostis hirtigluma subsp. patula]